LKNVPQLKKLIDGDSEETIASMISMPPNEILLRWVNYKLKEANFDAVENLGSDLGDGVVLSNLFKLIDDEGSPTLKLSNEKERLDQVV
jgi:plastin-1